MWWDETVHQWKRHPDCKCGKDTCICRWLRPIDRDGKPLDYPVLQGMKKPAHADTPMSDQKTSLTIKQEWLSYMDAVVPKGAPSVQIQESKRAFLAGAQAMLSILTDLGADNVPEDEGVVTLERLHQECREFRSDVLNGRA